MFKKKNFVIGLAMKNCLQNSLNRKKAFILHIKKQYTYI